MQQLLPVGRLSSSCEWWCTFMHSQQRSSWTGDHSLPQCSADSCAPSLLFDERCQWLFSCTVPDEQNGWTYPANSIYEHSLIINRLVGWCWHRWLSLVWRNECRKEICILHSWPFNAQPRRWDFWQGRMGVEISHRWMPLWYCQWCSRFQSTAGWKRNRVRSYWRRIWINHAYRCQIYRRAAMLGFMPNMFDQHDLHQNQTGYDWDYKQQCTWIPLICMSLISHCQCESNKYNLCHC